jgi:hypothetical protein
MLIVVEHSFFEHARNDRDERFLSIPVLFHCLYNLVVRLFTFFFS